MSQNNEIKMIIFDLGGVLFEWNPRYVYKNIFSSDEKVEHFLTHICNQEWNLKQDKGRTFADGNAELIKKFPEYKNEIELYRLRWREMLRGVIQPTVDLLYELKAAGYRTSALSNWSSETFATIEHEFEFFKEFETMLISGHEKLIKPDIEFYKILLNRTQVPAPNCIFIDDVAENITAGESLGIRGIQFFNTDQVRSDLKKIGVRI